MTFSLIQLPSKRDLKTWIFTHSNGNRPPEIAFFFSIWLKVTDFTNLGSTISHCSLPPPGHHQLSCTVDTGNLGQAQHQDKDHLGSVLCELCTIQCMAPWDAPDILQLWGLLLWWCCVQYYSLKESSLFLEIKVFFLSFGVFAHRHFSLSICLLSSLSLILV